VRLNKRSVLLVWISVVAYGIVDELHQQRIPGRDASVWDVLTDGVGAACVLWIASYLGRRTADESGLWSRLLLASGACVLAAAISTWGSKVLVF
jgi:hypothetical protein